MASWQAHLVSFMLRTTFKPRLAKALEATEARRLLESGAGHRVPRGLEVLPDEVAGVDGEWVQRRGAVPRATLLHLHGGGYFACSARTHRPYTCFFAAQGFRVYAPNYRLAPEHPFPAAVDDALRVYLSIADALGGDTGSLVVTGDSAGGGLALALMLRLRDAGHALPAAIALFSPWTDLATTGPSAIENEASCSMFVAEGLRRGAAGYLAGADPQHPHASPLYADLRGLPPMLVHAAEREAMRDDSVRLAERARSAGVEVAFRLWPVVHHDWQMFQPFIPEARESLYIASQFLLARVHERPQHVRVPAERVVARGLPARRAALPLAPHPMDPNLNAVEPGSSVVAISGLGKRYATGFTALKNVDLAIRRGEIFALLGPNGAGKTTLISIVCGIVTASSGQVVIAGHDIVHDYRITRSLIGLVPQELTTDAFESVWATVSFSRGLFGCAPNPALIEKILRDLSLWDKRRDKIMTLSGGMKRRVMIAKALSHEPQILFLDEPTAGVDVELRRDMWALVRGLRERGVTIILTTHYIEEAEEMADRIGVINQGELILVEDKATLMKKLGKKQLTIELEHAMEAIPSDLTGWQLTLKPGGHTLQREFEGDEAVTGVAGLLRRLAELGIGFKDVNTQQSSLEDIFVSLVRRPASPRPEMQEAVR